MIIHLGSKINLAGFGSNASLIYDSVRPCACSNINTAQLNGNFLDCSALHIDGLISKVHELGEDGITGPIGINNISNYLESFEELSKINEFIISDAVLHKNWAEGLSIVGREDRCTFCFTSSYGKVYLF
jgi:hypothetical protein